jgi:DNA-binding MarR family transcriptional regulator
MLFTIEKYPGRNAKELAVLLKTNPINLAKYTNTFEMYGWITKEKSHNFVLHRITEKGKVARVCFETLSTGNIPQGWIFEEELT